MLENWFQNQNIKTVWSYNLDFVLFNPTNPGGGAYLPPPPSFFRCNFFLANYSCTEPSLTIIIVL